MNSRLLHTIAPLLAVFGAMLRIIIGASVAHRLFGPLGAAGTTAARLFGAAILLSLTGRIWRLRADMRSLRPAILYGASLGCMNLLFYLSISRIPLGIALAVEFTGPLCLAIALSRRRLDALLIALAVAGLVLLLPLRASRFAPDPLGMLLALAAGVFWAGYIVFGKRAGARIGTAAPAVGAIVAALVTAPFGVDAAAMLASAPHLLLPAVAVSLLSTAIPASLEMFALQRPPARSYGVLTSGEPAMGAVVGLLMLGEALSAAQWLGIGAIVAASVGTTLSAGGGSRPAEPAPSPLS